mmetsp:Transcript_5369/g.11686  ORF Transcript_5369/g.11686 Transcript_5369/m.11686 type:complete len:220 (+) Transcript_5369:2360-3019(+)
MKLRTQKRKALTAEPIQLQKTAQPRGSNVLVFRLSIIRFDQDSTVRLFGEHEALWVVLLVQPDPVAVRVAAHNGTLLLPTHNRRGDCRGGPNVDVAIRIDNSPRRYPFVLLTQKLLQLVPFAQSIFGRLQNPPRCTFRSSVLVEASKEDKVYLAVILLDELLAEGRFCLDGLQPSQGCLRVLLGFFFDHRGRGWLGLDFVRCFSWWGHSVLVRKAQTKS